MNIDEAVVIACQEPTLVDALSWICVWENARALKQAQDNPGSGANGAMFDTCFRYCIQRVLAEYSGKLARLRHDTEDAYLVIGAEILLNPALTSQDIANFVDNLYIAAKD
jgi:hypothetical protein